MKKVGFIGAADKTDLIVYVAKVLEDLGKRVLVVDTTITQKTKYVVPAISPTRTYITDFNNVDYAIGFQNIEDITRYLGLKENERIENLNYDYMLIDIDEASKIEEFNLDEVGKNFFVTTFDIYSLKRGIEILRSCPLNLNLSKVLINFNIKKEDEDYLNYLTMDTRAVWNDFSVYIPLLDENEELIQDNQRVYRARLKRLIPEYQEGIIYIVQNIIGDLSVGKIKKMIRE